MERFKTDHPNGVFLNYTVVCVVRLPVAGENRPLRFGAPSDYSRFEKFITTSQHTSLPSSRALFLGLNSPNWLLLLVVHYYTLLTLCTLSTVTERKSSQWSFGLFFDPWRPFPASANAVRCICIESSHSLTGLSNFGEP